MSKKVRTTLPSRMGAPLNVYGQVTSDGTAVAVWTKHQNVGIYNLERFPDGRVTGATLRSVLTGES